MRCIAQQVGLETSQRGLLPLLQTTGGSPPTHSVGDRLPSPQLHKNPNLCHEPDSQVPSGRAAYR